MYIAFTVPPVPTGMKAGVRMVPRGMDDLAAARLAVGGDQPEAETLAVEFRSRAWLRAEVSALMAWP